MTGRREPLDPTERALAAALPRLHGRTEPDPALDARVLAMAHAAAGQATAPARRRSWVVPLSVAASITLAVGLAWRLRPLPPIPASEAMPAVAAPQEPVVIQRAPPAPPPAQASQPVGGSPGTDDALRTPAAASGPVARTATPQPPPTTPAAFPAMDPAAGAATPPAQAKPTAAPVAADARVRAAERDQLDAAAEALAADHDEDVPPATVDSPDVREAWLRRIAELVRQGRGEEARESLAEFRRRYPGATLPPELRSLEP